MSNDAPERIWVCPDDEEWITGVWDLVQDGVEPEEKYIHADIAKPRVKPLVWVEYYPGSGNWSAPAFGGWYFAKKCWDHGGFGFWSPIDGPDDAHRSCNPTIKAAKAAAQADYERRILEALE